jgi:hypothetical protein
MSGTSCLGFTSGCVSTRLAQRPIMSVSRQVLARCRLNWRIGSTFQQLKYSPGSGHDMVAHGSVVHVSVAESSRVGTVVHVSHTPRHCPCWLTTLQVHGGNCAPNSGAIHKRRGSHSSPLDGISLRCGPCKQCSALSRPHHHNMTLVYYRRVATLWRRVVPSINK